MSTFDPYQHINVSRNPDGSLIRHTTFPKTEANPMAVLGLPTVTKDVTINDQTKVWARIFRPSNLPSPSNDKTMAQLPILFYFHGGHFIQNNVSNIFIHQSCSVISSEIHAIVIAVDYRLAPEHRLPAQYDDAIDALLWLKKQVLDLNGEKWIKDYGDVARCYLCGRECGANIAFHTTLRALNYDLKPLNIVGAYLNQPLFGGKQRMPSEIKYATDQVTPLPVLDLIWELTLPKGTDRDHRFCNPLADEAFKSKFNAIGRCMVVCFSKDPLIDRVQEFVKTLVKHKVQVEAQLDFMGFRDIDLVNLHISQALVDIVKEFII